jgi:hypothetical protein
MAITRETYLAIAKVDPDLAMEALFSELIKTQQAVTTWYTACQEKDVQIARAYAAHRAHSDQLWRDMNEVRRLLGRLRVRALAGQNMVAPLENEMNRLHAILKKNRKFT